MTDSVIIAAPLLIAAIVLAVGFVGCGLQTSGLPGPTPPGHTGPPPPQPITATLRLQSFTEPTATTAATATVAIAISGGGSGSGGGLGQVQWQKNGAMDTTSAGPTHQYAGLKASILYRFSAIQLDNTGQPLATSNTVSFTPSAPPVQTPVTKNFTASGTFDIPPWCNNIDVILLGGGGPGFVNMYPNPGNGGGAGSWNTTTLTRGAASPNGFPTTPTITVMVGSGGQATTISGQPPTPGLPTTATADGATFLTAPGGMPGGSNLAAPAGASPGSSQPVNGTTYPTMAPLPSPQTTAGAVGNPPGGGGGGARGAFGALGGNGATGAAWIVAR